MHHYNISTHQNTSQVGDRNSTFFEFHHLNLSPYLCTVSTSLSMTIARNVSAVFEKLGYDPDIGVEIFTTVCERLKSKQMKDTRTRASSGDYTGEGGETLPSTGEEKVAPETRDENVEYRLDLDDFMTAAIEVDDSLIQAIQLVTRKRLFRIVKQRGNTLPSTPREEESLASGSDTSSAADTVAF